MILISWFFLGTITGALASINPNSLKKGLIGAFILALISTFDGKIKGASLVFIGILCQNLLSKFSEINSYIKMRGGGTYDDRISRN